ncbi:MAG: hypothetical protein U1E67_02445 [Hyphomicrobiales bacterium]
MAKSQQVPMTYYYCGEDGYDVSEKFKIKDQRRYQLDVQVRGRLVVTGKADTAVGEVGGRILLQAGSPFDDDNSVDMNQAYAWWKFSPFMAVDRWSLGLHFGASGGR